MVAALFTAAAVGVPCVAWFIAGSRAAEQEARQLEQEPRDRARQEAERIARRLAVRLESLRHSETRRSFLDYQPHLHDLPGDCTCEPQLVSPLARGPADPLVWTHFQIDEVGQLMLPSLPAGRAEDSARRSAREALSDEQAILEVLECSASDRLVGLPGPRGGETGDEVLESNGEWVVTVGPFQWHRVALEGQPALLALRQVSTPAVALTQGFVIRREEIQRLLEDSPYPVRLKPGPPTSETEARIPIDGEPWTVVLDASAAAAEAGVRAASVRTRFRANFAGGLLAALVAGALVVGLVRQADRLAQQRARFAASAAHELRTPLAGLRMYGEMLADESGDPAQHRSYARRIACEAERLGRVVANLLGFSKLERGELKLHAAAGDLGVAIRESLERLRPSLEASGARVEESICDTLPPVRFDRDAVHQILQNLLDNAARHGRSTADPPIRVEVAQGPNGPSLSVVDRGPGVEPSLQGKLFQAFTRRSSPDAPDGLGLGLALVQALAHAQDATVAYADETGGGSRFTVTFAPGDRGQT